MPSREEMIRMAVETRKQVTSAVVTAEQMSAWPADVEKLLIPTRVGDSEAYLGCLPGDGAAAGPLLVNFHGGGFIKKRTENDELFCRKMIHLAGCRTLDVDYRVAPEHPFPCGLYECYDVVCWVFEHAQQLGVDPQKVILAGHSAGGNFVAGICMLLEKEKRPKPLAVVMDYPPMDLFTDPDRKEERGKGIPAERARLYRLYYCSGQQQRDPLASPVLAPPELLENFPRALVVTAGEDDLCTEGEQFALLAARAGNEVTLKRFLNARHGFTIYRSPGYEESVELISRFIRNSLQ